jgi:hypothetical protein
MNEASGIRPRLGGVVRVQDEDALRRLLAQKVDFGCRPAVMKEPDGTLSIPVIGTAETFARLQEAGYEVSVSEARIEQAAEVGIGDRFQGGQVVPRGFGVKGVTE